MFQYCQLSQKPNVVRLLRILPSKNDFDSIRCELFEYTIAELATSNNPYEALSYCWGGSDKTESITLDNQEFAITHNLHRAMIQLRDHQLPRIIWIDAVCINQEDVKEKEHQIQFMASIYAKANCVVVWLGEAQDESDQALKMICTAGEKFIEPSNMKQFKPGILQLLKRPWFRRIWVRRQN
jgi:hypothetical protein